MTPPILQVQGLRKRFTVGGPEVVSEVSLEVAPGEILALVGPSGCGKTTLLRLIAGFERPDFGRIDVAGETLASEGTGRSTHVPPQRRRIGIVFQDFALFPHLTVLGNVMFGLLGTRPERQARALETLKMLSMDDFASRRPHTLSGGQQQRVALARTMATGPRFVLLDEPFSNLDPALREAARQDVKELLHRSQTAAILVTHDRDEALSFGDRVAVMSAGKIEQIGPPEQIYRRPETDFVARFLARAILLPAEANGTHATTLLGPVLLAEPTTGPVRVAIRPEQIALASQESSEVRGTVRSREFQGAMQSLLVEVAGTEYPVLAPASQIHSVGETVFLTVTGEVGAVRS